MHAVVRRAERLSPSMIRIVLSGGTLDDFQPTPYTDQYINAQFVPEGAPYSAPFDRDALGDIDAAHRPRPRRYTVRKWDADAKELTIDFVVHGDDGYAGRWAQRAEPGDALQFKGPGGGYAPDPDASWYLLAGDESALPAIAASAEALPAHARGAALIVVDGSDDELEFEAPDGVEVVWLHRMTAPSPADLLQDAVARLEMPNRGVDVFVHGEAGEVRAVRHHLVAERAIDPAAASISPYWRRTMTDEEWRAVKRDWLAMQAADA